MSDVITYKVRADYVAGFGWQYILSKDGQILSRGGNFDTEEEAIAAGNRLLGW